MQHSAELPDGIFPVAPSFGHRQLRGESLGRLAVLTEYFNRVEELNGDSWLIVTTIMEDPEYLTLPYITSTHFLREPDGAKWKPAPCHTDPPLRDKAPRLQE